MPFSYQPPVSYGLRPQVFQPGPPPRLQMPNIKPVDYSGLWNAISGVATSIIGAPGVIKDQEEKARQQKMQDEYNQLQLTQLKGAAATQDVLAKRAADGDANVIYRNGQYELIHPAAQKLTPDEQSYLDMAHQFDTGGPLSDSSATPTVYSKGSAVGGPDEMQDSNTNAGLTATGANLGPGMAASNGKYPIGTVLKEKATGRVVIVGDKGGSGLDIYISPDEAQYDQAKKDSATWRFAPVGKIAPGMMPKTPEEVQTVIKNFQATGPTASANSGATAPESVDWSNLPTSAMTASTNGAGQPVGDLPLKPGATAQPQAQINPEGASELGPLAPAATPPVQPTFGINPATGQEYSTMSGQPMERGPLSSYKWQKTDFAHHPPYWDHKAAELGIQLPPDATEAEAQALIADKEKSKAEEKGSLPDHTLITQAHQLQVDTTDKAGKPLSRDQLEEAVAKRNTELGIYPKPVEDALKAFKSRVSSGRNLALRPWLTLRPIYANVTSNTAVPMNKRTGIDDATLLQAFSMMENQGTRASTINDYKELMKGLGFRGQAEVIADRVWGALQGGADAATKGTRFLPDNVIKAIADRSKTIVKAPKDQFDRAIAPDMKRFKKMGVPEDEIIGDFSVPGDDGEQDGGTPAKTPDEAAKTPDEAAKVTGDVQNKLVTVQQKYEAGGYDADPEAKTKAEAIIAKAREQGLLPKEGE